MGLRDRVSIAVVTLNEEKNIAECLESAAWADEIIVVDSFSADRTVEISRRYTERVIQRPWPGFGKQKNFAINQARMEWTFVLDADERIPEELRREVEGILASGEKEYSAYRLARRNYFYGHWLRWGGQYPDWQTRLFRTGAAQYDNTEPHENLNLT
jgi:glycosyltransferase involved in cell wall biosynthesis